MINGGICTYSRGSQLKLPVRFGRILFLHSPGASTRVRASVLECNSEFVEGRIGLYDDAGKPCVLIDGFRAISVAGVRQLLQRIEVRHPATAPTSHGGPEIELATD